MTRIAFVNGDYVPEDQARVSIFDRGFLFGDGVYEAVSVLQGKLIDVEPHLARLDRSLDEVKIRPPYTHAQIIALLKQLLDRNRMEEGLLYFQVTRGAAPRMFNFPGPDTRPSFIAFCMPMDLLDRADVKTGVRVISTPEQRWGRRDIKSICLLPQCLGKQAAVEQGCYEAFMVEADGTVTEGTSSSAYMIRNGVLTTRPLSRSILPGVTRRAILALAKRDGIRIEEREFTLEEACKADEVCLTAASNFIMPVVEIDGQMIGNGRPGPVVMRLRELYIEEALASAI